MRENKRYGVALCFALACCEDNATDTMAGADAHRDTGDRGVVGAVGSPCSESNDCAGGYCGDLPGGYCALACDAAPCPAGSRCFEFDSGDYCLQSCDDDSDCRVAEGYTCDSDNTCWWHPGGPVGTDCRWRQVGALTDPTSDPGARFGQQLVLSSHSGYTLAVAAPFDSKVRSRAGAVHLYSASDSGAWVPSARLEADNIQDDANFGSDLDISADGRVVAVAAPREQNSAGRGAVYVFRRRVTAWELDAYLRSPELEDSPSRFRSFASSVTLSDDGNVLAVSDIGFAQDIDFPGNSGSIQFYRYVGQSWQQQTLVVGHEPAGDLYGADIALSSDGNMLLIGAPGFSDSRGRTLGLLRIPGRTCGAPNKPDWYCEWVNMHFDYLHGGHDLSNLCVGADRSHFGLRLAIATSGLVWVQGGDGRVCVTRLSSTTETEPAASGRTLIAPDDAKGFGEAIALSRSGQRLFVGAPRFHVGGEFVGAVHEYLADDTQEWAEAHRLHVPGLPGDIGFGTSLALSDDEALLFVGDGDRQRETPGTVRIFGACADL